MRNERGIEESGRFEGVFLREVRPDQLLSLIAQRLIGQKVRTSDFKLLEKKGARVMVALLEVSQDRGKATFGFLVGERHYAPDYFECAHRVGVKWSKQNPRGIGAQNQICMAD